MPQVYLDMDGVLADFDQHHFDVFGIRPCKTADNVDWAAVRAIPNFYLNIPPMPDMWELFVGVQKMIGHTPTILTGVPASVSDAPANKVGWVEKYLGAHVPVITCRSKDKFMHAKPGDVLIDDWDNYKSRWEQAGGVFIIHRNAAESLDALAKVL